MANIFRNHNLSRAICISDVCLHWETQRQSVSQHANYVCKTKALEPGQIASNTWHEPWLETLLQTNSQTPVLTRRQTEGKSQWWRSYAAYWNSTVFSTERTKWQIAWDICVFSECQRVRQRRAAGKCLGQQSSKSESELRFEFESIIWVNNF